MDARSTTRTLDAKSVTSQMATDSVTSRKGRVKGEAAKRAQTIEREILTKVLDPENKVDRTPQPLLKRDKREGGPRNRRGSGNTATTDNPTTSQSQRSGTDGERSVSHIESSQSSETENISTVSAEEVEESNMLEDSHSDSQSTAAMEQSVTSALDRKKSGISSDGHSHAPKPAEEKLPPAPVKKEWTAEDRRQWLQQDVVITLTETATELLFSRQDEAISRESDEADSVRKRNEAYSAFCEARQGGESGGRYVNRGMTTLNNPRKCVECEIHPPATKNQGNIQVTTWRLYDEFAKLNEEEVEVEPEIGVKGTEAAEAEEEGGPGDGEEGGEDGEEVDGEGQTTATQSKRTTGWLTSPSILQTVMVLERVVVGNVFEELQLAYRGIAMAQLKDHAANDGNKSNTRHGMSNAAEKEEAEEYGEDEGLSSPGSGGPRAKLRILWRYGCDITKDKNVSCLSWNRKNPDILAAGYGEYGIPGSAQNKSRSYGGMVCCWSLKNPITPERVIHIESESGVSAMHFSSEHPSLLAVGNTDGTLALYDVRKHGNSPALKTTVSTGQHTGTIWECRWVQRGKERVGENLVSISADGHIMEWSIKKGLERTSDLMKLKRNPSRSDSSGNAYAKGAPKEALLSRQSGGMCFDFNWREPITYVAGTEDGNIHKCSKSQNENYLLDYKPHEEPVYRVRWSPFCADYFLTCSADWTSRLYSMDRVDPVMKFANRQYAVHDVCWSPAVSTIFGTATSLGHIDIWDVADPLQPKSYLQLENRSLNCLLFGEQDEPVLTVGDDRGDVTVVKLSGMEFERQGMTAAEQEQRLQNVIAKQTA